MNLAFQPNPEIQGRYCFFLRVTLCDTHTPTTSNNSMGIQGITRNHAEPFQRGSSKHPIPSQSRCAQATRRSSSTSRVVFDTSGSGWIPKPSWAGNRLCSTRSNPAWHLREFCSTHPPEESDGHSSVIHGSGPSRELMACCWVHHRCMTIKGLWVCVKIGGPPKCGCPFGFPVKPPEKDLLEKWYPSKLG